MAYFGHDCVTFCVFLGHCSNFLLNVQNIWSHFGQSIQKSFAYRLAQYACGGSMLINLNKILRVPFCNYITSDGFLQHAYQYLLKHSRLSARKNRFCVLRHRYLGIMSRRLERLWLLQYRTCAS